MGKAAARLGRKFKDLKSKKNPKGGRDVSVTEPAEPTYGVPASKMPKLT
jgi:hypothetical protein